MKLLKKIFIIVEYAFVAILLFNILNFVLERVFDSPSLTLGFYYVLYFAIALVAYYFLRNKLSQGHWKYRLLFVIIITIVIRLILMYFIGIDQIGDYKIYLRVADSISNGLDFNFKYYGVFPHAVHYPMFMGMIYKIFGSSILALNGVNLLFATIEAVFVFLIIEKSVGSKRSSLYSIFVVLNPSSILFSILAGGELIYSAIIMVCLYILLSIYQQKSGNKLFKYGLFGLVLGLANFFRPTAIILMIAFFIEECLFNESDWKEKLKYLGIVLLIFMMVSMIASKMTSNVTGYEPPEKSFGWNMFVGGNYEKHGQWNWNDAKIINYQFDIKDDPSEIQTYFFHEAIGRYKTMVEEGDIFSHFANKFKMWLNEDTVGHLVTEGQNETTRFYSKDSKKMMVAIMTVYHGFIFVTALGGLIYHKLTRERTPLMRLISLYFIGSMCLFLILEQASRYKGSYYGMLTLFSVLTLSTFFERKNKRGMNDTI